MNHSLEVRLRWPGVLLLCPLMLLVQSIHAQEAPEPQTLKLAHAGLLEDVDILQQAYEKLHPGLYRYSTKPEMDANFAALRDELGKDVTRQDVFLALSKFTAKVRCGHTYPNFFNQSKATAEALLESPTRVPFYFVWRSGELVVTRDFTPGGVLPQGTRVLAIGGVPSQAILAKLLTLARADGGNDSKRVNSMQVTGASVYEAFDVYFPMLFPQAGTMLDVSAVGPGETKARHVKVAPLRYAERIAPIKAREAGEQGSVSGELFSWKYLPGNVAYLQMPTWALYNSKWDWKGWLNAHLDDAVDRKSGTLIVDLRGNEGGDDVGAELLPRLVAKDERIAGNRRLVRYRKVPVELEKYLDTWDPSFKNWGASAEELASPWPTAPAVPYLALNPPGEDTSGVKVIRRSAKPFTGKVIVLIDASNSSATFQFDQTMRQLHRGTLIGETTGGSLRGINGGAFFFLRLPHSGIELDLPLIGYFPASEQPDAGIVPDVAVSAGIDDIAAGRDAVLNAALKRAGR